MSECYTEDFSIDCLGEEAMVAFGVALGAAIAQGSALIFFEGDLGMGKTTLSRGVLQAFGHRTAVKSPTYTLVEPYQLADRLLYHFDLYRLRDPEELEYIGIRDYFESNCICLVEWAEKGEGFLPSPDLIVSIEGVENGRRIGVNAMSKIGRGIVSRLESPLHSD